MVKGSPYNRPNPGPRTNPLTTHINAGIPANSFIKAKAEIGSYEDCEAFLDNKNERKVASNVTIRKVRPHFGGDGPHRYDNGTECVYCGEPKSLDRPSFAVKLYGTDIIIYHPDGTFEFDNGGFNTPTTATRACQFGPTGWRFGHHKKKLHAWKTDCGSHCQGCGPIDVKTGEPRHDDVEVA